MATVKRKKDLEQELREAAALKFEALARAQGVSPLDQLERVTGGWPEDELDDGFEEAVLEWRRQGMSSQDDDGSHALRLTLAREPTPAPRSPAAPCPGPAPPRGSPVGSGGRGRL